MVGEMMTANDEREDHRYRDELLQVAAQILAGQCAYRADTQEKNIPAIITAAENLICEVNARFNTTTGGRSSSTLRPTPTSTPNSTRPTLNTPSVSQEKPSRKPSLKSDGRTKR